MSALYWRKRMPCLRMELSSRDISIVQRAEAHFLLGCGHRYFEKQEGALQEFEEAVRLDPGNMMYRLSLARMYDVLGRFTDANRVFEQIAIDEPGTPEAKEARESIRPLYV